MKPVSEDRDYLRVVLFSPRKYDVFCELVRDGADNTAIAKRLFVTVDTVKTHVSRILRDVDCRTRCELVARYYQGQLFVIPPASRWRELPVSFEEHLRNERARRELDR